MGRYARQEVLDLIGTAGQQKFGKSHIAIIGIGAIGSAAAELLARAGIGKLTLADRDLVGEDNLQRQLLFRETDRDKPKATAAKQLLQNINSSITITALDDDIDYHTVSRISADLILDCTDNVETRLLINDYCHKHSIPWVHAAALRSTAVVFPVLPGKACFRCAYGNARSTDTCEIAGVLNTATAIAAALQVTEALKILLGKPTAAMMTRYDAWNNRYDVLTVPKRPSCHACNGRYDSLSGKSSTRVLKFCGGYYQLRGKGVNIRQLRQQLKNIAATGDSSYLSFHNITIFEDGRALIKAKSPAEAKTLYARFFGG